jgi:uncharacterized LabA/DUF88 family protein
VDALRTVVYIDGANLYACLLEVARETEGKLDIRALADFVVKRSEDRLKSQLRLVRVRYYNALPNLHAALGLPRADLDSGSIALDDTQRKLVTLYQKSFPFYDSLSFHDLVEYRLGDIVRHGGSEPRQKGVDVRIATDLVVGAFRNQYDVAVLVSGDSDLEEAVAVARDEGKVVVNCFVRHGWAHNLRRAADVRIPLDADDLLQLRPTKDRGNP